MDYVVKYRPDFKNPACIVSVNKVFKFFNQIKLTINDEPKMVYNEK